MTAFAARVVSLTIHEPNPRRLRRTSQQKARALKRYLGLHSTTGNAEPNEEQTRIAAGMPGDDGAAVPHHD